ncbi:chemotaxis protein CheB [Sphingomonas sp.]|uniref:chemotaxis protein CheB n=1 Tax=Sphingomonas sp. TaxID=28214 RepID=UPI003B00E40C
MSAAPQSVLASVPDRLHAGHVLIVDDSVVARAVIAQAVDASDRYAVVGAVPTVAAALAFLATTSVDYILLDINLPGVDGITALPDLIAAGGQARVLIVSSAAADGAVQTVQALAFGAADTLVKPAAGALSTAFRTALIDKLDRLNAPVHAPRPALKPTTTPVGWQGGACDLVAIGASTGGIHALSRLLRELPAAFRTPVLVTQHLPATFMPYFAAQLALLAGRPCEVATDHLRIRPGRIVVAPGDAHVRVVPLADDGASIRLSREPSATGCMPSVDVMLASVAATYGARATAVVLSGMGRDGADGARALAQAGGAVVVQDEASSVIWGMPGAVAQQGIAAAVLPPDAIGRLLVERRR